MYTQFFGLSEAPFSISPNPKYLYMSERHGEALAHLNYGLQDGGGFVLLTGEVGTGKTTVSRCLLQQLPADTEIAYILNPSLTERDLLAAICDEYQLPYGADAGLKTLFDLIRDHLLANLAAGKRSVVLVDEAQHLLPGVLEQLRLLTNLETEQRKLLQVVLFGQPELDVTLARHEFRQLLQRITFSYRLRPLDVRDTQRYLQERLAVAGYRGEPLFAPRAVGVLVRGSSGIPRLLNILAHKALMAAFGDGSRQVTASHVRRAMADTEGAQPFRHWSPRWLSLGLAAGTLSVAVLLGAWPWLKQWSGWWS